MIWLPAFLPVAAIKSHTLPQVLNVLETRAQPFQRVYMIFVIWAWVHHLPWSRQQGKAEDYRNFHQIFHTRLNLISIILSHLIIIPCMLLSANTMFDVKLQKVCSLLWASNGDVTVEQPPLCPWAWTASICISMSSWPDWTCFSSQIP